MKNKLTIDEWSIVLKKDEERWIIWKILTWEDILIFGWELCIILNAIGVFRKMRKADKGLLGILMHAEH